MLLYALDDDDDDDDRERDGDEKAWAATGRAGLVDVGCGSGPWITLEGRMLRRWSLRRDTGPEAIPGH